MGAGTEGNVIRKVFVVLASLAVIGAVVSPADAASNVVTGDTNDNAIFGTPDKDTLNGLDGTDYLFGGPGNDTLNSGPTGTLGLLAGGPGKDKYNGGDGTDRLVDDDSTPGDSLKGGAGNDHLFSADGAKDSVNCGPGDDLAWVDAEDKVKGCENVFRNSIFQFSFVGTNLVNGPAIAPNEHTFVHLKAGDDTVSTNGLGGPTILLGAGADSVDGALSTGLETIYDDDGESETAIQGGPGDDTIYSADGSADPIDCGSGTGDTLYRFEGETGASNCENIIEGFDESTSPF